MSTSASSSNPQPRRFYERKTDRQDAVVEGLRERIIQGEFQPGSRLPTRLEIEQSFGASSITVQSALERLKHEGFVVASRRSGTHVVEKPPHLSHFALVFPSSPSAANWNRFWSALCSEAANIEADGDRKIPLYYGLDGHEDSEDYQNLATALQAHRLAGVIFGNTPDCLRNTPVLDEPGIARVSISSGQAIEGLPQVFPDQVSLIHKALDYLATRGCKKVAVIKPPGFFHDFNADLEARGLTSHPYWMHDISLWAPETARSVAHLLMQKNQYERPDAIFVTDDNLLGPVTEGLVDAGVRAPEDVEIIAHCNFPWPVPAALPVQRVGFDIRQVLKTCLDRIDGQRRGEAVPMKTPIAACLEEELSNR